MNDRHFTTRSARLFSLVKHYLARLKASFQREVDHRLNAHAENSDDAIFAKAAP